MSDSTLTSRINAARKAVGDSGEEQKLIRTIARKGFRFVGDVRRADAPPSRHTPQSARRKTTRRRARLCRCPTGPPSPCLPFTNMTGDPAQDYFSDGISEDIITALSKLRWFFVIARNSSFIYKGKAVHMKQIADELGVGYVVEGSVRKAGDRVRITAQLNDVATGSHIWAERYDRDLADVFAVQDEITEAIVAAIEPQLYAAENFRARRKPPDSMDAWDLVMRALSHYWRVTRQDNVVAQALLEKATAIDPNYGQALGVLATSHTFSAHMGWADMATVAPIAERAALGRDPGRQRGPLGALRAWAAFICSRGVSTIRWPSSSWRCGSIRISRWPRAITAWRWPIAGAGRKRDRGRERALRLEPARSARGGLLRHRRLRAVRRAQLRRGDAAGARRHPAARRFRRRPPGADGRRRHGGARRCRQGRFAGAAPRAAQYFARLDRQSRCRSSKTPSESTIWKASAAPAWTKP